MHEVFYDPQTGALAAAAARGDVAEIDRLVQAGAEFNTTGKDDVTPLAKRHLAGSSGCSRLAPTRTTRWCGSRNRTSAPH